MKLGTHILHADEGSSIHVEVTPEVTRFIDTKWTEDKYAESETIAEVPTYYLELLFNEVVE